MADLIKLDDEHHAGTVRSTRTVIVTIGVVLMMGALGVVALSATPGSAGAAPASRPHVSTVSVTSPRYTPHAAVGATDDYHCTWSTRTSPGTRT